MRLWSRWLTWCTESITSEPRSFLIQLFNTFSPPPPNTNHTHSLTDSYAKLTNKDRQTEAQKQTYKHILQDTLEMKDARFAQIHPIRIWHISCENTYG